MMVKTLPKVIYHGTKIFIKSLHKSILEEIELSREAARIRYKEKNIEYTSPNMEQMSLDEAMRILNIGELNTEELGEKYKHLIQANRKAGSFYLQSKVFRAKERVDSELANNAAFKNQFLNMSPK